MNASRPVLSPLFALPAIAQRLSPDLPLNGLGATMGDFWSWGFSNLLSNVIRPVFAEFVVASKLGIADEPRLDWNAFDLSYRTKRIEVKSSAYLQTWPQRRLSQIRFDIGSKLGWDAHTGLSQANRLRSTDCYVFCLFRETDSIGRNSIAAMDLDRWHFYVASVSEIEQSFTNQKPASLKRLLPFGPIGHDQLKLRIDQTLGLA